MESVIPQTLFALISKAFKERVEEINRLNVFPVPDGDTGTNMSLTLDAVTDEVAKLPSGVSLEDICHAATHGSLMGARGNSGVITSQIIRGLCEGIVESNDESPSERLAFALESATRVAYQAVRKPVEGTILTVCKDLGIAARHAAEEGMDLEQALDFVAKAGHASVARTPDLLPVLKESGVVDAGGYGLALIFDAFAAGMLDREVTQTPLEFAVPDMTVAPIDDWDDDEYLYCTEFLLFGDGIDTESVHDFLIGHGGSELIVGDSGEYKVHVHTDDPAQILGHVLALGEVSDVHINNMRKQQAARPGSAAGSGENGPHKHLGVVSVASGSGIVEILKSLGVDAVVSGGQTMNPSTADLVEAANSLSCDEIIFLPNNKNIVMAAQSAADVMDKPAYVVPTRSIPQAFAAMLNYEPEGEGVEIVEAMSSAIVDVATAEITTAIKDAKGNVGDIKEGQYIGIVNGKDIEAVGDSVNEVVESILEFLNADDYETLTLLAGEDLAQEQAEALAALAEERYPEIEVELLRGEQPLYPVILSVE
ncbi:MAG: DAK2 domain-containing protein [Coriobacteriia bacterium]|nr:DAK2 domain-containing protein [Coriobacteriia bacterium]